MRTFLYPCVLLIGMMIAGCAGAAASKAPAAAKTEATGPDRHAQNRLATVGVIWKLKNAAGGTIETFTTGVAINARAVATSAPFDSNGTTIESVTVMVVDIGSPLRPLAGKLLGSNGQLDVLVIGTEEDLPASVTLSSRMPAVGDEGYTLDFQAQGNEGLLADVRHRASVSFVNPPTGKVQAMTIDVGSIMVQGVGAGLFNPDGELIGIVTRPLVNDPVSSSTRAVVLPARYLAAFMRSSQVSATVTGPATER